MSQNMIKKPSSKVVTALLQCCCHLGGIQANIQMRDYIFGTRPGDKINIIDIQKMWDKMVLAARLFLSIKDTKSIMVVSNKDFGRKAVLKFCEATGATPITGRFIPGGFSNFEIKNVREPRLLIAADAFSDRQTIEEAAKARAPVIAFCNTDNSLSYVDVGIAMNNRSASALGAGFYLLGKIINHIKRGDEIDDNLRDGIESYIYRDADELNSLYQEAKREKEGEICMQEEPKNEEVSVNEE
ncbi:40S ribosomal protein SA (P40)/Laminin receptor 1 [Trachipleistophora hominis]|uniref:40S ribosomal protein SA (P40)/Laminin receptor 1 n=1 Tax=Trachipleistophora hominis TaxID=72359 RepID=L7JZ17_TRAHO|nr:40S ribosomal protein SA (P40)/Laminin receptor 1 [Trachipleistophora hominis]